jgi:hypothetical protein
MTGTAEFPLAQIPFAKILEGIEAGLCQAKPAQTFPCERIQAAHPCRESVRVDGKLVVTL